MRSIVFKSTLTLLVLGIVGAFAFNASFYTNGLISTYFAVTVGCGVIVLMNLRPHTKDAAMMVAGAIVLGTIDRFVFGYQWKPVSIISFLGLSSIAVLGFRSVWSEGRKRKILVLGLIPFVLFIGSEWLATPLLHLTERIHNGTLDLFLSYFDESLGVQASFVAGKMFAYWPWLKAISMFFYIGLEIPLILVYVRHLVGKGERALPVMIIFMITGPIGVIFYNLFPAAGPFHLFGDRFPFHPLNSTQIRHLLLEPTQIHAFPNAIPSLHMTWVLLAWWNSQGLSRLTRSIAFAFVAFTVLATLGTGEHYLVDLIVAFPYALMLQALPVLARRGREALVPFLFGLSTVLLWMTLLRFTPNLFWISPVIPWTLSAATIAASLWLKRRLDRPCISSTEIAKVHSEQELIGLVH